MSKLQQLDYKSPIGVIEILGTDEAISSIIFSEHDTPQNFRTENTNKVLVDCYSQIDEYFKGVRHEFSFP